MNSIIEKTSSVDGTTFTRRPIKCLYIYILQSVITHMKLVD